MHKAVIGKSKKPEPIMFWIETYLKKMRHEWPTSHNLAIVLDIDDTALIGNPHQYANPHIMAVYQLAKRLGYKVFFVTARPLYESNYKYTIDQLKHNGYTDFQGLFLMDDLQQYMQTGNYSHYKAQARKKIYDTGYDIVLNIGDTWDDIMLQSPYAINKSHIETNRVLKTIPHNNYAIIKPHDVSWMSTKMPYIRE